MLLTRRLTQLLVGLALYGVSLALVLRAGLGLAQAWPAGVLLLLRGVLLNGLATALYIGRPWVPVRATA